MKSPKKSYDLWIDCECNYPDIEIKKGKYIILYGHNVSVDERYTNPDYKEAFEITPDGDYHMVIEYKLNPESIHITTKMSSPELWQVSIRGE